MEGIRGALCFLYINAQRGDRKLFLKSNSLMDETGPENYSRQATLG